MKSFRGGAVALAVVAAALVAVAPAAARTRVVTPGHSIQRAINRSDPGDVVIVEDGHYRESLQINKRLTLRGDDNVLLTQPAHPANTICNQFAESPGQAVGICIVGQIAVPGGGPPEVVKEVSKVRVAGFTVRGFGGDGVLIFGARKTLFKRSRLEHNGSYGVFSNTSRGTRLVDDVAVANHAPGLYIGDSPHANAVVRDNLSAGNGMGIFLRNAQHGRVSDNVFRGNCVGILVLADAPGPAGSWILERNDVMSNNRACKGEPSQGEPPFSGLGIGLFGAHDTTVDGNRVVGNRSSHPSAAKGGIAIGKGDPSGTAPQRDVIEDNVIGGNRPFDLFWDGSGTVRFHGNECDRSRPGTLCH